MPNSAGVVGPDYLIPVDVDSATATHAINAQALADLGLINDTSATFVPANPDIVGPDYLEPISGDFSVGGLAQAMIDIGILSDGPPTRSPGDVVGPDYMRPIEITLAGITDVQFADAMAEAGYFNDPA